MTSGTSFMATENFSVSPLPGTSRHQSFPQIDNSLLCLERSGLRCWPVVQRVLTLPVGQDHHPHHSSSPTDPSPLTEVLSYQCRPGGPLQVSSGGHTHVMTIIDRSTIWAEMVPLISTTATACAEALVAGWTSHFGVPTAMTTDRGVQCTSAVWSVLCQRLGIKHITTTAYHRQLKDSLRARLASTDWPSHLPWVLLGLRAAPKEDHKTVSPWPCLESWWTMQNPRPPFSWSVSAGCLQLHFLPGHWPDPLPLSLLLPTCQA